MEASVLKEEARALFLKRRYAQCAQVYQRLTALEPGDAHLYLRCAEAGRRAGQSQLAAACYRRCAELFRQQGYVARACAAMRLALGLEPDHEATRAALVKLERLRAEKKQPEPAVAAPPAPEVHCGVELTLEEGEPALELHHGVELAPDEEEPGGALAVRRLSECAVAVRRGERGPWLMVQSQAPLQSRYVPSPEAPTRVPPSPPSRAACEELTSEEEFQALYPLDGRARVQASKPPDVIFLP